MYAVADVLGDKGRKCMNACVMVKIHGRPLDVRKYIRENAVERIKDCYAGKVPGAYTLSHGGKWEWSIPLDDVILPPETDSRVYDISDIHDALKKLDKKPFVERYPKPGSMQDEVKQLVDKNRQHIEIEIQEAFDNPDKRHQYSWLVAQRRVRDCFAGNFAGDQAIFNPEDPNRLYSIFDIYDCVNHFNEMLLVQNNPPPSTISPKWCCLRRKVFGEQREAIEEEYAKAILTSKSLIEYSRREALTRLKGCYSQTPGDHFQLQRKILPLERDTSGHPITDARYNILEIRKAMHAFDERKILLKYPEEVGPGVAEMKKAIEKNSSGVAEEYMKAKSDLRKYSSFEAERRVSGCFPSTFLEQRGIVSNRCGQSSKQSDGTCDIVDIFSAVVSLEDKVNENNCQMNESLVDKKRREGNIAAVKREFQEVCKKLGRYSRDEAERRVRNCFLEPFEYDTEMFMFGESEDNLNTCPVYDIFDIKKAVDHFDSKKFLDRHAGGNKDKLVDKTRYEIESEYKEAIEKVDIEHGSGFVISDHFAMTSDHVIIDTLTNNGQEIYISNRLIGDLRCTVARRHRITDIALLHCPELDLKETGISPLVFAARQELLPGMQICSFGYPVSHTDEECLFVSGYVSGFKKAPNQLCSSDHRMVVLNCSHNSGNSGSPVLSLVEGEWRVVGVVKEKHLKRNLTSDEALKIEMIKESFETSAITDLTDEAIKDAAFDRELHEPGTVPDPCQIPLFMLSLKLYDELETNCQVNLSNIVPGHCVVEFLKETIPGYGGEAEEELVKIIQWSEKHANILPQGHHSASECCTQ